jgi:hypothetical protein
MMKTLIVGENVAQVTNALARQSNAYFRATGQTAEGRGKTPVYSSVKGLKHQNPALR